MTERESFAVTRDKRLTTESNAVLRRLPASRARRADACWFLRISLRTDTRPHNIPGSLHRHRLAQSVAALRVAQNGQTTS